MGTQPEEIYNQYGVTLKRAPACYMNKLAKNGNLAVFDHGNKGISFDWSLDEYKVVDNQEWSIVVRPKDGQMTNSNDSDSVDSGPQSIPSIRTFSEELMGLEVSGYELRLVDSYKETFIVYMFTTGAIEGFIQYLKRSNFIEVSRKKRNFFTFVDVSDRDKLQKSFAELNIEEIRHGKPRNTGWNDVALEFFSKVPSIVLPRKYDDESSSVSPTLHSVEMINKKEVTDHEEMIRSLSELSDSHLPARIDVQRSEALTLAQLRSFQSADGRYHSVDEIREIIFRGGVENSVRSIIWKLLLGYDRWNETLVERENRRIQLTDDYYRMKRQWMSFSLKQEEHFSDYRDRKCQIEKDVKRTDRNLEYFEGEDNPNLDKLQNILMTYIMYNFDLGYVQGMSDLLAPILQMMETEEDSFWCFVGFMQKVNHNFDIDQAGMKKQLLELNILLSFANPRLHSYFVDHQSDNMYFCFRWLLVWFKREFSVEHIMVLWEVLLSGLPCKNFHLFIALAILDEQQSIFIDNKYEFNEILKHVNELSYCIDLNKILKKAESIYIQVTSSTKLTNPIRQIVGFPIMPEENQFSENGDSSDDNDVMNNDNDANEAIESGFENGINTNYY